MPFLLEELSLDLITALVPLMPRIKQRDKELADQLRRSAGNIGLNAAEAAFSDAGNRRARLYTAAGSANETRYALLQAIRWEILTGRDAARALALLNRIIAILWTMTRGSKRNQHRRLRAPNVPQTVPNDSAAAFDLARYPVQK